MAGKKRLVVCDACGGTGMLEDDECSFCMGEGKIEVDEEETWDPSEDEDDTEDLDEILDEYPEDEDKL